MSEKQQDLGRALQEGTLSLADSERPDNVVLAGLRMIGGIEEREDPDDLSFKLMKGITISLARMRMWSDEEIQEAIDEGRQIERMASGEGE